MLAGEGQVARVAGAGPGVVAEDGIGADAGLRQADGSEVADPLVPVVLVRAAVQRLGAARGGLAGRQRDGDEATRASGAVAHVLGDDIAQVIGPDGPLPGEMGRREAGRVEGEGRGGRLDRATRARAVEVVEHAAELVGAPCRGAERELVVAALRAERRGAAGELVILAVAGQAELDARAVPRQRAVEGALSDAELVAARGVRRRDVRVPVVADGRRVVVRVRGPEGHRLAGVEDDEDLRVVEVLEARQVGDRRSRRVGARDAERQRTGRHHEHQNPQHRELGEELEVTHREERGQQATRHARGAFSGVLPGGCPDPGAESEVSANFASQTLREKPVCLPPTPRSAGAAAPVRARAATAADRARSAWAFPRGEARSPEARRRRRARAAGRRTSSPRPPCSAPRCSRRGSSRCAGRWRAPGRCPSAWW